MPTYQITTHVMRSELVISGVGVESLTDRLDAMGRKFCGSGAAMQAATLLKEGRQGRWRKSRSYALRALHRFVYI